MKFVAIVSGDSPKLGAEELKQLSNSKTYSLTNQIVTLEGDSFDYSRVAYSQTVCELLLITTKPKLELDINKIDWSKHYKKSFRVDSIDSGFELKELGTFVWNAVKNPKVDLENADTNLVFIKSKNKILVGKLLFKNKEKFVDRRPHLRPGFHPSSLQPKLARTLINLAKVPKGKIIADPFCGTGGILLEACLLGYKVVGSDFSKDMIERSRKNLEYFKLKNFKLSEADATKVKISADAIVTDPPYGNCASVGGCDPLELYDKFLKNAYKQLKKGSRIVIMFPKKIKLDTKFKIIAEIKHYMHHSLTRHIIVFEK